MRTFKHKGILNLAVDEMNRLAGLPTEQVTEELSSSQPVLAKVIADCSKKIEADLLAKAKKYCGSGSKCQARVDVGAGHLNCHVWFDLGEDSTLDEAQELAVLFFGQNATTNPHKLVPGMWVAFLSVKLAGRAATDLA